VIYGERKMIDEEGFQYRYVPKAAVMSGSKGKGSRKQSGVSAGSAGK